MAHLLVKVRATGLACSHANSASVTFKTDYIGNMYLHRTLHRPKSLVCALR